jgi:glycosyltransferase involved in cell wall biosynthesis
MKILHISAFAYRGGCEKNCYHFINASLEHNHELIILGEKGPMTADWEQLGIIISHLKIVNKNIFSFNRQLKNYLKQRRYDYIICWSALRLPLQLNAIDKITNNIRVYLGNPISHNTFKDWVLNKLFPFSTQVILMACSNYVADTFKKSFYYKSFNLRTSLNPIKLPESFPVKNIDNKKFKIGMVARLDPIKDHKTVLKAFKLIKEAIPQSELHFAGDGILRKDLQRLASELGIEENTVFHGDVSDVYNLLNQWDIFVYSTTPKEGLGSVVAEAMANGLPCILCDLPMMHELAPVENSVLWFKPYNEIELYEKVYFLYNNPDLKESFSHSLFNYAKQYFGAKRFVFDYLK